MSKQEIKGWKVKFMLLRCAYDDDNVLENVERDPFPIFINVLCTDPMGWSHKGLVSHIYVYYCTQHNIGYIYIYLYIFVYVQIKHINATNICVLPHRFLFIHCRILAHGCFHLNLNIFNMKYHSERISFPFRA